MSAKKQFSHRLKLLRKIRKLSQQQLAERIDRSVETISHLERGLSFPNGETIDRLCEALSVPPRHFFSVTKEDGAKQQLIDKIDVELLLLDMNALEISFDQVRAMTKKVKSG